MKLLRSRWSTPIAAVSLGCLLVYPAPARAQAFVELGGGWNYVGPLAESGQFYDSGTNIRASIGWHVTTDFSWRIDAFTNQFDVMRGPEPCPFPACGGSHSSPERVSGLNGNGLLNVDSRGILYVIGGAGLYNENLSWVLPSTEWHFGVSAGAGIAVPVVSHLRAFVEARWHGLLGDTSGPSQFVPITVGLRF